MMDDILKQIKAGEVSGVQFKEQWEDNIILLLYVNSLEL